MASRNHLVAAVGLVALAGLGIAILGRRPEPPASGPRRPVSSPARNRLGSERSPYLLQHAGNPVHWFPWGEEAFTAARRENKPILLSSGYSTCHWCHVMNRESFQDPEIADLLNREFISIKIDREERPDVDHLYMTFLMATTGRGGWPMTVFLTPDLQPFVGGTYYPPRDRDGQPGFLSLIGQVARAWAEDRSNVIAHAGQVMDGLRAYAGHRGADPESDGEDRPARAFAAVREAYDTIHGGFGRGPKFPQPSLLTFLAEFQALTPDAEAAAEARAMLFHTLDRMAAGGIRDHLGGGFHRYAVDPGWRVPHFEKMLYDQAQLALVYLEAFQISGDLRHAGRTREILAYIQRDLTHPGGGFFSAEDAESPRASDGQPMEGAFYLWTDEELDEVLEPGMAASFRTAYGVRPEGNIGDLAEVPELATRYNVLVLGEGDEDALTEARQLLFRQRTRRPRPARDDKVITAWNGLAISAFARAGVALDDPGLTEAAVRAATFVQTRLYDPRTGTLARAWRGQPLRAAGVAADYAYLIQGLLDLFEATQDVGWLKWAMDIQATQDARFSDRDRGGYFQAEVAAEGLGIRFREEFDEAEPSASSVAARNLLRLYAITANPGYRDGADRVVAAFAGHLDRLPSALPLLVTAEMQRKRGYRQVVIAGAPGHPGTQALLATARRHRKPGQVLLLADGGAGQAFLAGFQEAMKFMAPLDGRPTAYVCENFICQFPVHTPEELAAQLGH